MAGMGQANDGLGAGNEDTRPEMPSGLKWGSHQPNSSIQEQGLEDFLESSGVMEEEHGEGTGKQPPDPLAMQMRPREGRDVSRSHSR